MPSWNGKQSNMFKSVCDMAERYRASYIEVAQLILFHG
jgi:hypothetical protein